MSKASRLRATDAPGPSRAAESLGYPTAWLGFGQRSISDLAHVERVLDATATITVATAAARSVPERLLLAYEQAIGRREVGQSCYGGYRAAATRALTGTLDDALQAWLKLVGGAQSFNGAALAGEPKVSATEKYRYWRARLADGTHIDVSIYQRPDGRISLGVQHRPFPERAAVDAWRGYWKEFVAQLTRKEVA